MGDVNGERRTRRYSLSQLDMLHVVLLVAGVAGGGGLGTLANSGSQGQALDGVRLEVKASRAEIVGKLELIEHQIGDHTRRITALEKNSGTASLLEHRLNAIEKQLDELKRNR